MFFWHVPAPNEALLISGSTSQGIRLNVRAVAAFKVGDDQASIGQGLSILDTLKKSTAITGTRPPAPMTVPVTPDGRLVTDAT
jgi:hypothetical protein